MRSDKLPRARTPAAITHMPRAAAFVLAALLLAAPALAPLHALAGGTASDAQAHVQVDADAEAAVAWVAGARWSSAGTFVDFPDHVVYPVDSWMVVDALRDAGALHRVDALAAARAAVRVQEANGGFRDSAGGFFGPFMDSTRHGIELAVAFGVPFDREAATAWVKAMQNPDGGWPPRAGLVTFLSATHDALRALELLDALDPDTAQRAEDFLLTKQAPDGGWPATMYQGDVLSTVTSTYHAVEGLRILDALNPATGTRAAVYLLAMQRPTGGFSQYAQVPYPLNCITGFCDDVEEVTVHATAHAVLALGTLGVLPALEATTGPAHAQWLANRQVLDEVSYFRGAFDAYADYDAPVTRYTVSSTLALKALRALDAVGLADEALALDYFARLQHDGTGGFGWWPGYLSEWIDTEAALRALARLGGMTEARPDALAATAAAYQRGDGAITDIEWQWEARLDQTAQALRSLAMVDRLGAVDAAAAAASIAARQGPEGGVTEAGAGGPGMEAMWWAVRGLAAVDALHLLDADAAASWIAGLQKDDGRISDVGPWDFVAVWDTGRALEALALLDRLDAVDVEAASSYLEAEQRSDGGFRELHAGHHVVTGLAAAGALDRIDAQGAADYFASFQTPRGGFAMEDFYITSAMQRTAAAVDALHVLGAV